uniref:tRNA (cytosine(34)-C(5))-methyltransferase n=1 Tax=Strigamia maritima TaxID=126957 RepID=T1IHK3_STRMM
MDWSSRKRRRNRKKPKKEIKEALKQVETRQGEGYDDIVKDNEDFKKYYKLQGILPETEWDTFMDTLKESLPVAFRITGSKNHAKALLNIIRSEYFDQLVNANEESEKPVCLSWYPENLAWQLNLTRKSIRTDETFSKLHNFLVFETNSGNISRQEVVSMIPPLLLDVQPNHFVLDMCAAPGSKTTQLIEMLHSNDTTLPGGMLVANDVDNKRCYMLVHQAKRLHSPCFLITNHDASSMPNIRMINDKGETHNLKYDRILCDVPCSGDGTLRKNYDVWRKWNSLNGNNLHGLQMRIAKRGLEMLAVGGLLVYSTCSFNPVENEAVVHNLLKTCEGSVELLDVSAKLPGLKYRPGLSHWKVTNRNIENFDTFDEVPEQFHTQIRPHMFPPPPEEVQNLHLNRCIRIVPHDQNTGGFFVAVLKKVALLPGEKIKFDKPANQERVDTVNEATNEDSTLAVNIPEKSSSPPRKRIKICGFREDPFYFFNDDVAIWPTIQQFYKINSTFDPNCMLTRCESGKKRNIYLVTRIVKNIITNNQDRIKVVNTGVKIFCRNDSKGITSCSFRVTQEGLQTVLPFINSRRVNISKDDLILLLSSDFPFNNKMSPETRQHLATLETGCIILLYQLENKNSNDESLTIALCGWKGATSTRAYVPKGDRIHYLQLCGVDVSKYDRKPNKSTPEGIDGNVDLSPENDVKLDTKSIDDGIDESAVCDGIAESVNDPDIK